MEAADDALRLVDVGAVLTREDEQDEEAEEQSRVCAGAMAAVRLVSV